MLLNSPSTVIQAVRAEHGECQRPQRLTADTPSTVIQTEHGECQIKRGLIAVSMRLQGASKVLQHNNSLFLTVSSF